MPLLESNLDAVTTALADIPATPETAKLLRSAARLAADRESQVRPTDVLLAMMAAPSGLAAAMLESTGIDTAQLAASLVPAAAREDPGGDGVRLRPLVVHAFREAEQVGHHRVDPVHLLLALLYSDSPETARPLQQAGLNLVDLRQELQSPGSATAGLRRRPAPPLKGVVGVSWVFLALLALTAAAGAGLWVVPLVGQPQDAGSHAVQTGLALVFVLGGWIASVCVHEFGHAFTAYLGGDRSVIGNGYLTLNPIRYTHPLLSLAMPVAFILLGGFAFPGGAVYIDRRMLRSYRWESAVALAGPAGTLLSGLLMAVPFWIGATNPALIFDHLAFFGSLAFLVFLEATGLIINLIPIPGLDGYNAIAPYLPPGIRDLGARIQNYGIMILFLVLWQARGLVGWLFGAAAGLVALVGVNQGLIAVGRGLFP